MTQARELLPPGRAAGFRVRVGDLQLISYRSLDGDGPLRTVLGQHTGAETFLATMNGRGQVEPLVQVDVTSPARGK